MRIQSIMKPMKGIGASEWRPCVPENQNWVLCALREASQTVKAIKSILQAGGL